MNIKLLLGLLAGLSGCDLLWCAALRIGLSHWSPLAMASLALLGLTPQRSLAFVAEYLSSGSDEVAEVAALALGDTRMTEAFPVLRDALQGRISQPVRFIAPTPSTISSGNHSAGLGMRPRTASCGDMMK